LRSRRKRRSDRRLVPGLASPERHGPKRGSGAPLRPPPLLIVHQSPEAQQILVRLVSATRRQVCVAGDIAAAERALADNPQLLIIDHASLQRDEGPALLESARRRGVKACILLLDPAERLRSLPSSFETIALSHVVTSEMPILAEDLVVTMLKL